VKKRGDDRKWLARVLAIGTECDIALLTGGHCGPFSVTLPSAAHTQPRAIRLPPFHVARRVAAILTCAATSTSLAATVPAVDDGEFWLGVQPLRFGPLPNLQESVYVVGYPIGGDTVRGSRSL